MLNLEIIITNHLRSAVEVSCPYGNDMLISRVELHKLGSL